MFKNILCRFGIHSWGKYDPPTFGEYTNIKCSYILQSHKCGKCGLVKEKIRPI